MVFSAFESPSLLHFGVHLPIQASCWSKKGLRPMCKANTVFTAFIRVVVDFPRWKPRLLGLIIESHHKIRKKQSPPLHMCNLADLIMLSKSARIFRADWPIVRANIVVLRLVLLYSNKVVAKKCSLLSRTSRPSCCRTRGEVKIFVL